MASLKDLSMQIIRESPADLFEAILERWYWNNRAAALGNLINICLSNVGKTEVKGLTFIAIKSPHAKRIRDWSNPPRKYARKPQKENQQS